MYRIILAGHPLHPKEETVSLRRTIDLNKTISTLLHSLSVTKFVDVFSVIPSVLNLGIIYAIDADTFFLFYIHEFIKITRVQYQVILVKFNIDIQ